MAMPDMNLFAKSTTAANGEAKPKTNPMVYLNVVLPGTDENGEAEYLSLPFNLALDTMPRLTENPKEKGYHPRNAAKNRFLDKLLELAFDELEPAEGRMLGDTAIAPQLYRSRVTSEVKQDEGDRHMAAVDALSFGSKKKAA